MSCHYIQFSIVLLLSVLESVFAYKLSPVDGQADIGAYHVQPGRCADVERHLGSMTYGAFFHTSPFHTTFAELFSPNPAIPSSDHDTDDENSVSGVGVEQMDATSLCAFNPSLTEGYGGGFDQMKLYLVYSRCIYGSDEMRALCGTTDALGRPNGLSNLVQASCPTNTKCKNLCATMENPSLTSPYAAKQVQLAQCMPLDQWQKLTDMYRPRPSTTTKPEAADVHDQQAKIDPKVVDKVPQTDPTKDPTHVDTDGTIPGKVLPYISAATGTGGSTFNPSAPPQEKQPQPEPQLQSASRPIDSGHQDALTGAPIAADPHTLSAPKGEFSSLSVDLFGTYHPTKPDVPTPEALKEQPGQKQQLREHQKAPTEMGFRKRSLRRRQASSFHPSINVVTDTAHSR